MDVWTIPLNKLSSAVMRGGGEGVERLHNIRSGHSQAETTDAFTYCTHRLVLA